MDLDYGFCVKCEKNELGSGEQEPRLMADVDELVAVLDVFFYIHLRFLSSLRLARASSFGCWVSSAGLAFISMGCSCACSVVCAVSVVGSSMLWVVACCSCSSPNRFSRSFLLDSSVSRTWSSVLIFCCSCAWTFSSSAFMSSSRVLCFCS